MILLYIPWTSTTLGNLEKNTSLKTSLYQFMLTKILWKQVNLQDPLCSQIQMSQISISQYAKLIDISFTIIMYAEDDNSESIIFNLLPYYTISSLILPETRVFFYSWVGGTNVGYKLSVGQKHVFLLSSDEPMSNSLWDKGCSVVFFDLQLWWDRILPFSCLLKIQNRLTQVYS